MGFVGFSVGQVGFPAGQKWRQRKEDEVLGSAGSPFAGSPFTWAGRGGRDRQGEGEEEEENKKKKTKKKRKKENQCWDVREGEEEEKSWVFCSHSKILYFFLKIMRWQLVSGGQKTPLFCTIQIAAAL
jgi:hypothetical protein